MATDGLVAGVARAGLADPEVPWPGWFFLIIAICHHCTGHCGRQSELRGRHDRPRFAAEYGRPDNRP